MEKDAYLHDFMFTAHFGFKKWVLYFALPFIFFGFAHPFYLSVTDLKYKAEDQRLQGMVKIFSNDLEEALKILENKKVDLLHPADKIQTQNMLKRYLERRLKLKVNSKSIEYDVLGFETEEESIRIYIESRICQKPKQVIIENSLLYDFLKEQMNIVNFESGSETRTYKVNNPEKRIEFNF
jgi:hypothetical protein